MDSEEPTIIKYSTREKDLLKFLSNSLISSLKKLTKNQLSMILFKCSRYLTLIVTIIESLENNKSLDDLMYLTLLLHQLNEAIILKVEFSEKHYTGEFINYSILINKLLTEEKKIVFYE
jgi:hypothetical protein